MVDESVMGYIACEWTAEQQKQYFYSSHVKLFLWCQQTRRLVGVNMKERPVDNPKNEAGKLSYLTKVPKIPAPKV